MTDAQKYQKRKNQLIILFMILLVVFVCVMCWIVIYAKNNPPETFLDPADIEIKQMQVVDYIPSPEQNYITITESNSFIVTENGEELQLVLNDTKEIKLLRDETQESINIMQNDNNINNNIKLIYQRDDNSLILTETGELYKLIDNEIVDGQLNVGQILTNMTINELVYFSPNVDKVLGLNEENKLINIDTLREYNGVIEEIKTTTSTIYVYEDNSFGIEEGKVFVDEYNNVIKINISFDNKIISDDNVIYEINAVDNTLSTSSLGEFRDVGYRRETEDDLFSVTVRSTTGIYDFNSNYYYMK